MIWTTRLRAAGLGVLSGILAGIVAGIISRIDMRLTMDVEGDTKGFFGFFKFAEPLVARAGEKLLNDDLARLKKVLESQT